MKRPCIGRTFWALASLVLALPAQAHEVGASDATWTFDPFVLVPLALATLAYLGGAIRLRNRAGVWNASRLARGASYGFAMLALAGALVSPLHWLGEHLFTFHMIEHEIVMAVAAPLIVLGRPAGVFLWSLPQALRRSVAAIFVGPLPLGVWRWVTRPMHATVLHGAAIWLWHIPAVFDAAVIDVALHRLQHLSFLVTAIFFWWAMLRRSAGGVAVWHLFVTMIHTSVLGAWIALAPKVLYHVQTVGAPGFGLTPLEDQQLAGIIMWIPAETVYAGAALVLMALWIRRSKSVADAPTRRLGHAS